MPDAGDGIAGPKSAAPGTMPEWAVRVPPANQIDVKFVPPGFSKTPKSLVLSSLRKSFAFLREM